MENNTQIDLGIDPAVLDACGNTYFKDAYLFAKKYINYHLLQHTGFKWIKNSPNTFDDMAFKYNNLTFSVLLNILYNGNMIFPEAEREISWLNAAVGTDMHNIIFPIMITDTAKEYKIRSVTKDLQFWDGETEDPILLTSIK